jgi:DNA topoisomerase-3
MKMSRKLIITEKASVARDFARVLNVNGKGKGFIENDKVVITWCVGHLVEMLYPESYDIKYKKWRAEDLPFLPENYKYGVIKNVSEQYNIVHSYLNSEDIDTVYWAGDSGKEGQTIEENIRNFGGVREGMNELRVWIDSQTDDEIKRGIREAKPMSDYARLGDSGIMRAIEDYALGINFSRALSVKYGKLINDAAATKSYTAIAVGRVMTCVLGMVVVREREIRNFVDTPFFRVVGSFTDDEINAEWKAVEGSDYFNSPVLYKENGFKKKENAEKLISELTGKKAFIENISKSIQKKKAPLLFNLAELQAECAKRFKISPDETLSVAQDLYERKLTTYPRTDARVLSSAVAKEIDKNLTKLKAYEKCSTFVDEVLNENLYKGIEKTSYTDDSKITDHYAIIPTGQITGLDSMSSLHQKVYELIVRRFLSIFYPPAEFAVIKCEIKVEKEHLFASSKTLEKKGYMKVAGVAKNNDNGEEEENTNNLENLFKTYKKGDELTVNGYIIKEGKTTPPKRYTSGTMILAMENAGNLIEDQELREQIKNTGIGTSATRAEIIKKLVNIGYLKLNSKTQVLTPERLGEMIYEVVNLSVPSLLNPEMSASWEKGLDGITKGSVDVKEYRAKLEDYIRTETLAMTGNDLSIKIAEAINPFTDKNSKGMAARKKLGIACPECGGVLTTTSFGYGCSNYFNEENKCSFTLGKICGVDIPEEEFKKLILEGHTNVISGFVSKKKKKFSAELTMTKNEEGKNVIGFNFDNVEPESLNGVVCPDCGSAILKKSFGYGCAGYKAEDENSCHFAIGKIAGKTIPVKNVMELLQKGKTEKITGFKAKSGSKFDACLALEKDETGKSRVKFVFDSDQERVLQNIKCPNCGSEIIAGSFGYKCKAYDKEKPDSCKFSVGRIYEKRLNEKQLSDLIEKGITDVIYGFVKDGNKFNARLKLNKNEEGKCTGLGFDFGNA